MRRITVFLLCALLCGCGAQPPQTDSPAESREKIASDGGADNPEPTDVREHELSSGCVMTTEYPAYAPDVDTVTVLLENRSEEWVETGAPFALEVELDNGGELDWFRLAPAGGDLSWNAIAYSVAPGGTLALQCNLHCYDCSISAGSHFRIVKSVGEGVCAAEFTISADAPITAERPYGFAPLADIPADYAPETAAEEGCVVFATGQPVQNGEAIDTFLAKASLGIPCQLRLARFKADGAVVEDVVHKDVTGIGSRFTYQRWENGAMEPEQYFSFLHTDGWYISLSNALLWNDGRAGEPLQLLAGDEAAPHMAAVQTWADGLAETNVTRCRVWNEAGTACGGLLEGEPLAFSVCTPGIGITHTVPNMPETAEITAISWQDDATLRLTATDSLTGEAADLLWDMTAEKWIS